MTSLGSFLSSRLEAFTESQLGVRESGVTPRSLFVAGIQSQVSGDALYELNPDTGAVIADLNIFTTSGAVGGATFPAVPSPGGALAYTRSGAVFTSGTRQEETLTGSDRSVFRRFNGVDSTVSQDSTALDVFSDSEVYASAQFQTIKWGEPLFPAIWSENEGGVVWGLAVDSDNNVFIAFITGNNLSARKRRGSDGVVLWEVNPTGTTDRSNSVATDIDGDCYFTFLKVDGTDTLYKMNGATGATINSADVGKVNNVRVDAAKNVYITTDYLRNGVGGGQVEKLDSSFNPIWSYTTGFLNDGPLFGVDVDTAGNVYCCGVASRSWDGTNGDQRNVWKLDPEGNLLWSAMLGHDPYHMFSIAARPSPYWV
jgi:hypothetical protein